jgi:RNA polymerase sigma factor (TIGR02999 family)
MDGGGDVTLVLHRWRGGDPRALDDLLAAVYPELRRLAARQLRGERANHSLQPTALVNEVYLRLIDQNRVDWQNRAHFLAIAARLARRILVDHARRRAAWKRGLGIRPIDIDEIDVADDRHAETDLVALDTALARLALLDPRQARVVECRFFGGLSIDDTAEVLGVSPGTVKRDWTSARVWLFAELSRA